MKLILTYTLSIIFASTLFSQDGIELSKHQDFYINGDATFIANNIVSEYVKLPFNNVYETNDKVEMQYIDVDNDLFTFSSSSATLNLPKGAQIKSATLYWSAIYSYERGAKKLDKKRNMYVIEGNNVRHNDINQIKLKTPTSKKYINIKGTILYDSYNPDFLQETRPYVCFADVTNMVKQSQQKEGEFTVANIRATRDFVPGGSAGGWLIFVVYEEPNATKKYITTYHGFKYIRDGVTDIEFKDFKTKAFGKVNASTIIGVLEGDSKIKRDECLFYSNSNKTFVRLETPLRERFNFFSSKISANGSYINARNPNGKNTLGFDVAEIKIPNKNNKNIANNATNATLRFNTRADRFNVFFTAFKTEINDGSKIDSKDVIELQENKTLSKLDQAIKQTEIKRVESLLKKEDLKIPNLKQGYYIVTKVYSEAKLANIMAQKLRTKNYNVEQFINPKNKWNYISVYNNTNVSEVFKHYKELVKKNYFKDIWVFKINM